MGKDHRDPDDPIGTSAELRRFHEHEDEPEDAPPESEESAVADESEGSPSDEDEAAEESDRRESE